MNPLPPLLSLLAIAAGVYGGFTLGAAATPEPLDTAFVPGFTVPDPLAGDAPDSLFHAGPLREALAVLIDRFPPGATVSVVTVNPDSLIPGRAGGPNVLPLERLPVQAPERMLDGINELRARKGADPVTLDDVRYFSWATANPTSIEWSASLDSAAAGRFSEFSASRDGSRVQAG